MENLKLHFYKIIYYPKVPKHIKKFYKFPVFDKGILR